MHMKAAAVAILLMTVSACSMSSQQGHAPSTPSATGVASSTPQRPVLFAVTKTPVGHGQPGTVAIVGMDGRVVTDASFQPRAEPQVPDAYIPLQAVAQVVGSSVYYIDGGGTVRVLRADGEPQAVAHFSLPVSQVDTWFAVSPDGSRVIAGILALPSLGPLVPGTSWHSLVGSWSFRLMTSTAGAAPHLEEDVASGDAPSDVSDVRLGAWWPTFPVAWTSAGPIAMHPVALSSQNAWRGGRLQVVVLGADGIHENRLGGSDCSAAAITATGVIPCVSATDAVSLRDSSGNLLWTTHVDGFRADWLRVSPGGEAITDGQKVETRSGGMVALPAGFHVQGWLDDATVIGRPAVDNSHVGNLGWISLDDPTNVHDLGIDGDFVATLA